jgi:hypothetical protein
VKHQGIIKLLATTFLLIGSFALIAGCTKVMRMGESDWNQTSKRDEGFTWDQSEEIYEGDYTVYTIHWCRQTIDIITIKERL